MIFCVSWEVTKVSFSRSWRQKSHIFPGKKSRRHTIAIFSEYFLKTKQNKHKARQMLIYDCERIQLFPDKSCKHQQQNKKIIERVASHEKNIFQLLFVQPYIFLRRFHTLYRLQVGCIFLRAASGQIDGVFYCVQLELFQDSGG